MKKTYRAKLTEGNINKQIVSLTIPMIWGIFAVIAFNLADTFFVAKLGTTELAAISFTFPVVMILGFFVIGIGTGVQSLVSRAIGVGDHEKITRLSRDSLILAFCIVCIFMIIGLNTIDLVFTSLGADKTTLPLIEEYMSIWYIGIVFLVVPMVGNHIIRASGDMKLPALIMIVSACLNIILDPLLIFGYGIFPRLGIKGAAIATVISRGVVFFLSLSILYRKKLLVVSFRTLLNVTKVDSLKKLFASWIELLHIGLPAAGSFMIIPLSVGVITRFVSVFGNNAVAAFGVATRIEGFVFIIIMALSSSLGPFVGQNFGAKKIDRVHHATSISFRFSIIWGVCVALILAVFGDKIVSIFDKTPEVINIATIYFLIAPISYGMHAIINISCSIYNAIGRPKLAAMFIFLRVIVFYVPMAYIGHMYFGIYGIFIAFMLSNFIVGALAIVIDRKNRCV